MNRLLGFGGAHYKKLLTSGESASAKSRSAGFAFLCSPDHAPSAWVFLTHRTFSLHHECRSNPVVFISLVYRGSRDTST